MSNTQSESVAETPPWFTEALSQRPEYRETVVDGVRISYRAWGEAGAPPVVLIHGGAAHAGWWDHIAPALTRSHRVIAYDISGHGDSDRREEYSLESWAAEAMAVAEAESSASPIIFGHSLGGLIALTAATMPDYAIRGTLAIDSSITPLSETRWSNLPGMNRRDHTIYPDRAAILNRYRTIPEDAATLPFIRDHVAAGSIGEQPEGFTWKFDPGIFATAPWWDPDSLLSVRGEVVLLLGERGAADADIEPFVRERFGDRIPVEVIADSGHHVLLDQPLELIRRLRLQVARWS